MIVNIETVITLALVPTQRHNYQYHHPPSEKVYAEMDQFISWFNSTSPTGKQPLLPLIRSGIAHLYFESIPLKMEMAVLGGL